MTKIIHGPSLSVTSTSWFGSGPSGGSSQTGGLDFGTTAGELVSPKLPGGCPALVPSQGIEFTRGGPLAGRGNRAGRNRPAPLGGRGGSERGPGGSTTRRRSQRPPGRRGATATSSSGFAPPLSVPQAAQVTARRERTTVVSGHPP